MWSAGCAEFWEAGIKGELAGVCWTGSTALKDVCSVKERKPVHMEDSEDKEEAEGTCLIFGRKTRNYKKHSAS